MKPQTKKRIEVLIIVLLIIAGSALTILIGKSLIALNNSKDNIQTCEELISELEVQVKVANFQLKYSTPEEVNSIETYTKTGFSYVTIQNSRVHPLTWVPVGLITQDF